MAVDSSRRQATIAGIPAKQILLPLLTVQTSAFTLLMHYSRVMPAVNGQRYFASTAVFLNEVIKFTICLTVALFEIATNPTTTESSTALGMFSELARSVFTGDSWKLAIPAALYTLQNSLLYVAISNLDAATFQTTSQLKIITTAVFSVLLLGKTLGPRKWLSLILLMAGVAIVQIPVVWNEPVTALSWKDLKGGAFHAPRNIWDLKALGNKAADELSKRSATYEGIDEDLGIASPTDFNTSSGLFAIILACVTSGLAGVYFEKILKDSRGDGQTPSVWIRNVQLSFYSIWPALFIGVLFKDGEHIAKGGFFAGYNWVVWTVIVFQATGGILVGLVVNYADNIAKNFAASLSIALTFLANVFFFDFEINSAYIIGTAAVFGATYLYNSAPIDNKLRPPPINISEYEKGSEDSYFDIESITTGNKSPGRMGVDARSTSRPTTPTYERRPNRARSVEKLRLSKREA